MHGFSSKTKRDEFLNRKLPVPNQRRSSEEIYASSSVAMSVLEILCARACYRSGIYSRSKDCINRFG